MDERLPKIDHIISTVFIEALSLSTGVKHRRTRQVEREARAFLEAEVDPYLTDDERILLAAEREFEPNGAACRVLEAEVLIVALVGFIKPPHLATDLLLRRVQLDLVDTLVRFAVYDVLRDQDLGGIRREFRSAMLHARDRLKRDRKEQSWAREVAKLAPRERAAITVWERELTELAARKSAEPLGRHDTDPDRDHPD